MTGTNALKNTAPATGQQISAAGGYDAPQSQRHVGAGLFSDLAPSRFVGMA